MTKDQLETHFIPNHNDPKRVWINLGGDLEASYDGARYVDIRMKRTHEHRLFMSKGAFEKALTLFDPKPLAD